MKQVDPQFLRRSRQAFASNAPPVLQVIRDRVAANEPGTARRDTLSALDATARLFQRDLSMMRATPQAVRELFASRTAAELGISDKRYANIRSCVVSALRTHGEAPAPITKRIPLTPAWRDLLARIGNSWYRPGLYRLASFCSFMDIPPEQVGSETLLGLFEALQAEEVVKDPRRLLKHTIALWNMHQRRVPGWPDIRLSSPFERAVIALPLSAFPESFRQDLARWQQRVSDPDPLNPNSPVRPLRPVTVKGQTAMILRFASALVHRGVLAPDAITDLKALAGIEQLKEGARFFLERNANRSSPYIWKLANTIRFVAIHYCNVEEATRIELTAICKRLDPREPRQMASKNRGLLKQFDDPQKVARLLAYPEQERARGLAQRNPLRAAKCFERAVAAALLICTSVRIENLRTINMNTDFSRAGSKWYLSIDGERVKNRQPLEFELPEDVASLLQEFTANHRSKLAGSEGPYLFPGRGGGPRADSTLRADLCDSLRKRAGLTMTPHLFRHAVAKIVVERDPGLYLAVSRQLGHKRLDMTMAHYLGTETRAAGRQINRLLHEALATPELPED